MLHGRLTNEGKFCNSSKPMTAWGSAHRAVQKGRRLTRDASCTCTDNTYLRVGSRAGSWLQAADESLGQMRMGQQRALGGKMPPRYTRSEPNTDVNDVPPSPSDHLRGEGHVIYG